MGYFLLKYWNKPFVLEIYIRVTKKNCIYTIKIGYGLTLIQKSYVKSPLGFLSFQTSANDTDDGNAGVSIPFGVFTLPNCVGGNGFARFSFQSPLGFLLFQTRYERILTYTTRVSIPFEVFTLPNYAAAGDYKPARIRFQSPLRCLLFQTASLQSQYLCGLN